MSSLEAIKQVCAPPNLTLGFLCPEEPYHQYIRNLIATDYAVQKLSSLRSEVEVTTAKNEELQAKVKHLEQESISKEQEIKSLTHRNGLLEGDVEKLEEANKKLKDENSSNLSSNTQVEGLQRRLQLLEDEAEEADRNMRETNDKYESTCSLQVILAVPPLRGVSQGLIRRGNRLRQTDVKAGHYERKVQALEAARDQWEEKYEEMNTKYKAVQKELQDFHAEIGNI